MIDDDGVQDEALAAHFYMQWSLLQGRKPRVKRAYAVYNAAIKNFFDSSRASIKRRAEQNPGLFSSEDWKWTTDVPETAEAVKDLLREYSQKAGWNLLQNVRS